MKAKTVLACLPAALLLAAPHYVGVSFADLAPSISYNFAGGATSAIYYNPGSDAFLHGENLAVTSIAGNDTAANAATHTVSNGALNFKTGAFTGKTGTTWNFGSGGQFTVTGAIADLGLSSTSLLTGSFASASVTGLGSGKYLFNIVGATLNGAENSAIYPYFGLASDSKANLSLNLSVLCQSSGAGFTSLTNFGGVIADVPEPSPSAATPIPAAAWLFGSGILGLAGIRKRNDA